MSSAKGWIDSDNPDYVDLVFNNAVDMVDRILNLCDKEATPS